MKHTSFNLFFLSLLIAAWVFPTRLNAQDNTGILNNLERMLETVSTFEPDQTRAWHQDFLNLMAAVYRDPRLQPDAEKLLVRALEQGSSGTGSIWICRELGMIGTDYSVDVLSGYLADPEKTDIALFALEKIPGEKCDAALRKALDQGDRATKIAIMSSLPVRKDLKSVDRLQVLAGNSDRGLADAAIRTLGIIGGEQAARVLEKRFEHTGGEQRWIVADAWLTCADGFLSKGETGWANRIYMKVHGANPPLSFENAALRGMFLTSEEQPVKFLADHIQGSDTEVHRRVMGLIYLIPEPSGLAVLFEKVPDLPGQSKLLLMNVLSNAGDHSIRPLILEMLKNDDPASRISALKALSGVGTAGDARLLATIAAEARGQEREMARQSLYMLSAPGTGDSIMTAIASTEGSLKAELLRSTGERNMTGAIGLLFESASDPDRDVKLEAIRALGRMGPPEILPEVTALLAEAESARVRGETEQAILTLLQKVPEGTDRSTDIIKALDARPDPPATASLISILGQLGEPHGLPVMKNALSSGEEELQLAAIRALSVWPDDSPLPDLIKIVTTDPDPRKHTLALRGCVDLITRSTLLSAEEKLDRITMLWKHAGSDGEKKSVISGLGKISSIEALDMAMELVRQGMSKPEAETAVLTIASGTGRENTEATVKRLKEFLTLTRDPDHIARTERILERIKQ
jgi:HEAT repeat protein